MSWPIFGPFSQFWGKKLFSGKYDCHAQLHMGFQHHAKIKNKLIIQSSQANARKDGRMDRRTEGQTVYYRTLPATARHPKIIIKEKCTFFKSTLLKSVKREIQNIENLDMEIIFSLTLEQKSTHSLTIPSFAWLFPKLFPTFHYFNWFSG